MVRVRVRVRIRVTLRLAVYQQSVHLRSKHLKTHDQSFFFNWTLAAIVLMWHPLWREDASVVYNCCWSSPAQSISGPSPAGLMTTFYCFRFETPPTWRARSPYLYPPGTGYRTRLTLLITFRHEPHRKHLFYCYSPTIPRPSHAYPLPRERPLPSATLPIHYVLIVMLELLKASLNKPKQ
jgi:hypothetical protein